MNRLVEQKDELVPITQALQLDGADVLDLGCDTGSLARRVAKETGAASVTAMDVDAAQIARAKAKGGGVNYLTGGAEALPLKDASLDAVVMMKSLHHVPIPQMDAAFSELSRVLRPGGCVYICEPAYEGPFNEILRIFHDEGVVRAAALEAIKRALVGQFELTKESDYLRIVRYQNLEEFRSKMMNLPWLQNRITPEIEAQVAAAWPNHAAADGSAALSSRMLVFVLRKR
ncbi:MAG: class I SAM-dependent methyltransferase [Rhodobacteraceae bacterium]|nr:class I SAM-dependent methyltransferase [Paracoccaceae bacterium]